MGRFDGRGVVVTGGGEGIGYGISAAFVGEGANLVIADIDHQRAEQTARTLTDLGPGRATAVKCDVTNATDVGRMVAGAIETLGQVDVFCNNVGMATLGKVVDLDERDWDLVMNITAKPVFLCTRAVLPHMLQRKAGVIINTGSEAGHQPHALVAHYCAAKAAVLMFTKAVALEVAPHVRVNAVSPGSVDTEGLKRLNEVESKLRGISADAIMMELNAGSPLGRIQKPRDIANAVLFLASDEASEITGVTLLVTGGYAMA